MLVHTVSRFPARNLAMTIIAALAFLGVSVSMCNFSERSPDAGRSRPVPD
jgi:hypothetical protein